MPLCIPEPESNKPEVKENAVEQVNIILPSSDEEDEDVNEQPQLNGYEPLPVADVDYASTSDDEDVDEPNCVIQHRNLEFNSDLVKNAMKNVKLDVASIPPWAKEISENAWNEVVQRTVKGTANATNTSSVEK